MSTPNVAQKVILDPEKRSSEIIDFERRLLGKIVGQDRAIRRIVNMYQVFLSGMTHPGRPIGNLLFLGPTGSGKTRVVEASAEVLFGSPNAFIKIDCAEFQYGHEIAKLVGSPPGYLGHRETPPILTQEKIDQYHTDKLKLNFILFDEIEKANDSLWQLLLGILDKGTLTLGDNRKVDLSHTVIFMTSNLGAKEMRDMRRGGIGFLSKETQTNTDLEALDKKLYRTALDGAKQQFSPEFMNRLDKVVVFRTLIPEHLRLILDIELKKVQDRILSSQPNKVFVLLCTTEAKEFLLKEGVDATYGARHLKRAIERYLVIPLSSLIATGQIELGDVVTVSSDDKHLVFSKDSNEKAVAVGQDTEISDVWERYNISPPIKNNGGGLVKTEDPKPAKSEYHPYTSKNFFWENSPKLFRVDNRVRIGEYKVTDIVQPKKNVWGKIIYTLKNTRVEIVGFFRSSVILQINGGHCVSMSISDMPKMLEVIH